MLFHIWNIWMGAQCRVSSCAHSMCPIFWMICCTDCIQIGVLHCVQPNGFAKDCQIWTIFHTNCMGKAVCHRVTPNVTSNCQPCWMIFGRCYSWKDVPQCVQSNDVSSKHPLSCMILHKFCIWIDPLQSAQMNVSSISPSIWNIFHTVRIWYLSPVTTRK